MIAHPFITPEPSRGINDVPSEASDRREMAAETCAYVMGFLAARSVISAAIRIAERRAEPRRFTAAITSVFEAVGSTFIAIRIVCLVPISSLLATMADPRSYNGDGAIRIPEFDSHMRLETAWYIATGICTLTMGDASEDITMMLHHVVAVVLVQMSMVHDITRLGMALLPYLSASTPLLHVAKALRKAGFGRESHVAFVAFFFVFVAGRVLAFPALFIAPILTNGAINWIPAGRSAMFYTISGLMGVLYALQVVWFVRIARILRNIGLRSETQ